MQPMQLDYLYKELNNFLQGIVSVSLKGRFWKAAHVADLKKKTKQQTNSQKRKYFLQHTDTRNHHHEELTQIQTVGRHTGTVI